MIIAKNVQTLGLHFVRFIIAKIESPFACLDTASQH